MTPITRTSVHRIEVRTRDSMQDSRAQSVLSRAKSLGFEGLSGVRTARVYLVEIACSEQSLRDVVERLLCDPVVEAATLGAAPVCGQLIEVHPLPGVMDPAAQSVRDAVQELTGLHADVSTGVRYDVSGISAQQANALALGSLANPAVHHVTHAPFHPDRLPRGTPYEFRLRTVTLTTLDDAQLQRMSREAHLFLSLAEMRAVRDHYRSLGKEPTDIELETIAQTWSEHCVHKTLKSRVRYTGDAPRTGWKSRPGVSMNPDGSVTIDNLLKHTVAAATHTLISQGIDWTLSIFRDNSGVVAFDDHWGVNIKVETHNRPSAIEPYGGAATGIGGCIRDVIGTGLGARPIASTDVFCVADSRRWQHASPTTSSPGPSASASPLPPGVLHPKRVLTDVVAGVRDYGNRMGIPTVSGGVFFDDRYVGNPLVFCGCVGLLPRTLVSGKAMEGDRIIALGGRTGRDGIHGATFSSAELQSTASTEFAHAVQIGNAIEEKRVLDAILRARDAGPLFSAITDCGAGGFSSAIGEMGGELGANVQLERAPVKYAGLSYTEVWISEAQERMILAVPPKNVPTLRAICEQEGVELADLGTFGNPGREILLSYEGNHVGTLSCAFLNDGLPMPTREAVWTTLPADRPLPATTPSPLDALAILLNDPNIASKHWIIRQYDHEVQGATIVKPLVGPMGRGPGDASVVQPVPGSNRAIALSQGLCIGKASDDPYDLALLGLDECVRNLVCVGSDPSRIAILDNFCWPNCDDPRNMGALVRACLACYDGALAYATPFVSGKDSLSNQLRTKDPVTGIERLIEVPYTLLITGLGLVHDTRACVTMDAKSPGSGLWLLRPDRPASLAGSFHVEHFGGVATGARPTVDLTLGPAAARAVHDAITRGLVSSAHDVSEGGLLVAIAEMLIAGSTPDRPVGARVEALTDVQLFSQTPSSYVLELAEEHAQGVRAIANRTPGLILERVATLDTTGTLSLGDEARSVEDLSRNWRGTLDW